MSVAQNEVLTPGARRILDAAGTLFYRHGIAGVGVDTIAAESGVTKRTLYDRFGSKEALVTAYLQDRHDRWWIALERRLATARTPRALAFFAAYADGLPDSDRGCAFVNAAGELPSDHPGRAVIRAHKKAVRARLVQVVGEDDVDRRHAERLGEHVFLLLEGAIARRGIEGTDRALRRASAIARRILAAEDAS